MEHLQTEYFECQCFSTEHVLRFIFAVDEKAGDPEVYTEVFLNPWEPWYKRVWKAVKYIFGYKCRYGHWDCTNLKPKDVVRLRKLCQEFEQWCKDHPDCGVHPSELE